MRILLKVIERLNRPGVLGFAGKRAETATRSDLAAYFRKLRSEIEKMDLPTKLVPHFATPEVVAHTVDMALSNVLRRLTPELMMILSVGIHQAMLKADKIHPFAEAQFEVVDKVGLTGEEAAAYAAEKSASLVTGINATTRQKIADIISQGILKQLGVEGTARSLKELLTSWTTGRARTVASTEINDAMSEATMRKLKRLNVEYKQLITSDDACPICGSIEDAGPVPIDEPFVDEDGEEYDRSPIHTGCRCATSGARNPNLEEAA